MFEAVYSCVLPLGNLGGCNQVAVVSGFFLCADCFFELKRDLVARLHIGCIISSAATCLMLEDVPMTTQQGMSEIYLVRIQTTRQNSQDNRQGALADGLHGLNPRITAHSTPLCKMRTALIRRLLIPLVHRWYPSQCGKRTNPSSALGAFFVFNTFKSLEREGRDGSIHPWRTVVERKVKELKWTKK